MDFYQFIEQNINKDTLSLRLSANKDRHDFDLDSAITQIECRKKFGTKFKNLLENGRFLFPDNISAEQASHQAVASYHAKLASDSSKILDMTAGLGVDSIAFADGNEVTAVELNPLKAETLKKNLESLGIKSIDVVNADSIDFLKSTNQTFDLIFVDPSRRDTENRRVYNLHDCGPDIISNQELLLEKASRILIKASPLLDVTQTLKDFQNVKSIRAIGVKGECKELLIELDRNSVSDECVFFEAVNLDSDGNLIYSFSAPCNNEESCDFISSEDLSEGCHILEPSAMVMKFAPWGRIATKYNAKKFDRSSHLFISKDFPEDFPGRVTRFKRIIKRSDRKSLEGFPATVVSKNHPLKSDEIRKTFRLKEGDCNFLYAARIDGKPVILLSESVTE